MIKLLATDYNGMDIETLQRHKMQIQSYKDMCNRNIVRDKEQISDLRKTIKQNEKLIVEADNELLKIEEAMKYTDTVKYEPVIIVRKEVESVYIGPEIRSAYAYYSRTDWKDVILYYFTLYNVNVLGSNKGMQPVCKSKKEYSKDDKASLNAEILTVAKQYNVKKIYLDDGVKINTTMLKKEIPDINIQIQP